MPWTRDSTTGVYTHSGVLRDFLLANGSLPSLARIYVDCTNINHQVRIVAFCTQDGRTGWELGINPSDASKITIRRIAFGVAGADVVTPVSHNIPSGTPFRLQVDIVGYVMTLKTVASGVAPVSVSYNNTADPTYTEFKNWGFASSVPQAVVVDAASMELNAVEGGVTEALVVVCGGNVYIATEDDGIAEIQDGGSGAFPPTSNVSLAVLDGVVWGVGGGRAKQINVLQRKVLDWGPDDIGTNWDINANGALPGAQEVSGQPDQRQPGTTTATIVAAHGGRLYLAGMDDEPHAIYASAVREPQMWWTAEPVEGRAFALGVSRRPGISYTVLNLSSVNSNLLYVGCDRSMQFLVGDPIDGFPQLIPVANDIGVSGQNAATTAIEGLNVVHSPDAGLVVVQMESAPVLVSASVLTEKIQFDRNERDSYFVSVVRDTQRHGALIFLTRRDGTQSTHFWYDERIGGYDGSSGGFFPEQYHPDVGPTCAVNWRGKVVLGGRTGYLWEYDDSANADENPTAGGDDIAINAKMPLSLMNDEDVMGDTILSYLRVELSDDSHNASLAVYGGATVESAYSQTNRELLFSRTVKPLGPPIIHRVRSRALVAEISSVSTTPKWRIEAIDAETSVGHMLRHTRKKVAAAPGAKCEPFVPSTPTPPPPPGSGPGSEQSARAPLDVLFVSMDGAPGQQSSYIPPTIPSVSGGGSTPPEAYGMPPGMGEI